MRRIISFTFVAMGLILAGCSDQSSLVGPTQQISQQQGRTFIDLPISSLDKSRIEASENIDGAKGGKVKIKGEQDGIKFKGELKIPKGAFVGSAEITIKFDGNTTSFDFSIIWEGDNQNFVKPLLFSGKMEGLNLDDVESEDVDFGYFSNGDFQGVEYKKLKVDTKKGKLEIKEAQLWHFSRYGWAK